MPNNHETKFVEIIKSDQWLMTLLGHAASLQLNVPWAIAAGAVRSSVWDNLHEFERKTPPGDIDFIFFDRVDTSKAREKDIEQRLALMDSTVSWEAVNQASVHTYTEEDPYPSIEHAMTRWAETATAIALYLEPHLVTPKSKAVYLDRIAKKDFQRKWPKLTILMPR
ncbi:MAG: nucleotidyltransferase family protein [Proteobacteria bacterium]|nr:nucleotidyltransferase family protein [Pseudomonadota bacterium]